MPSSRTPLYPPEVLRDVHERAQDSLKRLMRHCRAFTVEEVGREHEGFGHPSIRLQLHHEISAEKYWLSVIQGKMEIDENESDYRTIDSLESYRAEVFAAMEAYLREASAESLSTARPMTTWRGEKVLVPAHIVMRTQVHYYHHQGQILAMCRLLGKPGEGMDYPLTVEY